MIVVPDHGILRANRSPDVLAALEAASLHAREASIHLTQGAGHASTGRRPLLVRTSQDALSVGILVETCEGRHLLELRLETLDALDDVGRSPPALASILDGTARLLHLVRDPAHQHLANAARRMRSARAHLAAHLAVSQGLEIGPRQRITFRDDLCGRQPRPRIGGEIASLPFATHAAADAVFRGCPRVAVVDLVVVGDDRKPIVTVSSEERSFGPRDVADAVGAIAAARTLPDLAFDPALFPKDRP